MNHRGGLYVIRYLYGPEYYVGATIDFRTRKARHWSQIRKGKAECTGLAEFAGRAGRDPGCFSFVPLMVCANADMKFFENRALEVFHGKPGNLNRLKAGNVPDDTTRAKLRAAHKARPPMITVRQRVSDETRALMSLVRKGKRTGSDNPSFGKVVSAEGRARRSAALKGRYVGAKNPMFGKGHSPETRAKMSASHIGERFTPERCANISASVRGIKRPYLRHDAKGRFTKAPALEAGG